MKGVEDQLNLAREEALRAQQAAREAEQRKTIWWSIWPTT